jgi:hypothetical protein
MAIIRSGQQVDLLSGYSLNRRQVTPANRTDTRFGVFNSPEGSFWDSSIPIEKIDYNFTGEYDATVTKDHVSGGTLVQYDGVNFYSIAEVVNYAISKNKPGISLFVQSGTYEETKIIGSPNSASFSVVLIGASRFNTFINWQSLVTEGACINLGNKGALSSLTVSTGADNSLVGLPSATGVFTADSVIDNVAFVVAGANSSPVIRILGANCSVRNSFFESNTVSIEVVSKNLFPETFNILISNNNARQTRGHFVRILTESLATVPSGISIQGNSISSPQSFAEFYVIGMELPGTYNFGLGGILIADNSIEFDSQPSVATGIQMFLEVNGAIIIKDNLIINSSTSGIAITGRKKVIISGNTVISTGGHPLYGFLIDDMEGLIVEKNIFSTVNGVIFIGPGDVIYSKFSNNIINTSSTTDVLNTAVAVRFAGGSPFLGTFSCEFTNNQTSCNSAVSGTYAFRAETWVNCIFNGNSSFTGTTTGRLIAADLSAVQNIIVNNRHRGSATLLTFATGSNIVGNNLST